MSVILMTKIIAPLDRMAESGITVIIFRNNLFALYLL